MDVKSEGLLKPTNWRRAVAIVLAVGAMQPAKADDADRYTARVASSQAKRLAKYAQLKPEQVAATAKVEGDEFDNIVTVTTLDAFKFNGNFTDRVRSDNLLRAFIDRRTGSTGWQLYQTVTYAIEARRFYAVAYQSPSGVQTPKLEILDSDVDCTYGTCTWSDTLGFEISEDELEAIAAQHARDPQSIWRFKFRSKTGYDWTDDISTAEIAGALMAVKRYRRQKGFE